ncbi:MAG TPA: hypothetical protein P5274_02780 [Candidatus Paceibacterota bacterium]|nr:hypothetical protein [Candidatus Paceibacterota bacterium]
MQLFESIKTHIINPIIFLLIGVALVIFLFGLVQFLLNKDKASANRQELYDKMIWGVVGLAIMISVFGIMQFIVKTLNTLVGG